MLSRLPSGMGAAVQEFVLGLALLGAIALVVYGLVRWYDWSKRFLETADERGVGKTGTKWAQDKPYPECFDDMGDMPLDEDPTDDWWYD